jgi:L-histidine N-alpha-methyltransferase
MGALREEGRLTLHRGPARDARRDLGEDVRAGLTSRPKWLSCRHLYDARGSELFDEICRQPEYYPTRAEARILREVAPRLAASFDEAPQLIELGSGSSEKTRALIEALIARFGALVYEPIDISPSALEGSARELLEDYPELEVRAVADEYLPGLRTLATLPDRSEAPRLIAWLGSSIGNFHREDAARFLRVVRESMRPEDRLLVGIDQRKDAAVLEEAYDDDAGVTAAFMRNLLTRIDREFGSDFRPGEWRYRARYDEGKGRVEMVLESPTERRVEVPGLDLVVDFEAGEQVHLENSYKYSPAEVDALAGAAGLRVLERWTDPEGRFTEVLMAR